MGGNRCGERCGIWLKFDFDVGPVFQIGQPGLKPIFSLLLEDQSLDFILHFLKGAILLGFLVLYAKDVKPVGTLDDVGDAAWNKGCDRPFDGRQELAATYESDTPAMQR